MPRDEFARPALRSLGLLGVALAATLGGASEAVAQTPAAGTPLAVEWIGPVDADLAGGGAFGGGNGIDDLAIRVDPASLAGSVPVHWAIYADGQLTSQVRWEWPESAQGAAAIHVQDSTDGIWLYFDPFMTVAGDRFRVSATFADGSSQIGLCIGEGIGWGATARWLGQTPRDLVGATNAPSGCKDWGIEVSSPRFDARRVARWDVWLDYRGTDDYFQQHWSTETAIPDAVAGDARNPVRAEPSGDSAILLFEPALAREGDQFVVRAVLDDGSSLGWTLAGGGTDWGRSAIYGGRGAEDRIGERAAVPDGVNDLSMEVFDPKISNSGVRRVALRSGGRLWEWPLEDPDARFLSVKPGSGSLELAWDNPDDRGGELIFVAAVLSDGRMLGWAVAASRSTMGTDAVWLGQIADAVGAGDAGEPEARPDGDLDLAITVAHDLLGFMTVARWEVEGAGRYWGPPSEGRVSDSRVAVFENGTAGRERTIYFSESAPGRPNEPIRRGAAFDVRAILADGNVIHWRIASPGSPVLTGARWETGTRQRYRIGFDAPGAFLKTARVHDMAGGVAWTSRQADGAAGDAALSAGADRVTVALDRARGALVPGTHVRIEALDANGVRHYGDCVVGVE